MKNRIWYVFLAIVLVASLVAFAACEAEEEPEEVFEWPPLITFASVTATSSGHLAAVAWGTTLEELTGTKVRVIAEANQVLCRKWAEDGTVNFCLTSSISTGPMQTEATTNYAQRDAGPMLSGLFLVSSEIAFGFMTRADSDIKSPYDLRGKTIGVGTMAPDWPIYIEALLAWGNLTKEDVILQDFPTIFHSATAVMEGRVDLSMNVPDSPTAVEIEASPKGQAWITLDPQADPEGAARFLKYFRGQHFGTNERGVPSSIGVKMPWMTFCWQTLLETDEELIYQLVKWSDENYDAYKDKAPGMHAMKLDVFKKVADTWYYPIHPGAIRYLKEKGLWDERNERLQEVNMELLHRYYDAYQEAIAMADEQDIDIDPGNDEWIELWENYKIQLGLPLYQMMDDFE